MWNFLKEVMGIFELTWNEKNASLPFIGLFLCALYYLWKTKGRDIKTTFVYPVIIYACIIFNPFVQWILIKKLGFSGRSHRFFWVIPMVLVLAYTAMELLKSVQERKKKTVLFLLLVAMCAMTGRPMGYEAHYRTENIYKVTDSLVDVSAYLQKLQGTNEKKVFFNDDHMGYMARQYDPSLVLAVDIRNVNKIKEKSKSGYTDENMNASSSDSDIAISYFCKYFNVEDIERAVEGIRSMAPEYIVLNYRDETMENMGVLRLLDQVDDYYVYTLTGEESVDE